MANLYIFGNGFDIHHDLPTKYIEFKRFLETEYGCSELGLFLMHLPESTMDNHGGYIIEQNNKKEAAQFLYNVIQESVNDDKWTDFEESLGNIECLDLFYSDISAILLICKKMYIVKANITPQKPNSLKILKNKKFYFLF